MERYTRMRGVRARRLAVVLCALALLYLLTWVIGTGPAQSEMRARSSYGSDASTPGFTYELRTFPVLPFVFFCRDEFFNGEYSLERNGYLVLWYGRGVASIRVYAGTNL